ncbi:hypothetical protein FPOAC2_13145 [Fusarium poae]
MAESRDAKEDLHMQEDDALSDSGFRISGTIVVGIDIGTSASGIAYARFNAGDPTTPRCYIHTANLHGASGSRVDTKILADSHSEHYNSCFLEWFKMSLLRDVDLPSDVHRSSMFTELTNFRKPFGVSAKAATAKYLSLLWSDFQESLKCSVYDFEYKLVVTVPTGWPLYACQTMLEAIHEAGILSDKVTLANSIPDIEAASIALISDLSRPRDGMPPILKHDDLVVICDCGGFTTESTAYMISLTQPFNMRQITIGECIFAGGDLIDNAFMTILKAKMEKSCPSFKFGLLTGQRLRDFAHHHWKKDMKCNFRGDRRGWTFDVPDQYGNGTGQTISFTAFGLALVFDPIVDKIVNLVRSQIEAITKRFGNLRRDELHVIIAGGFGRSPYVQTRIKQAVLELAPSTSIHCPSGDQGCTAVARGAVLQGLRGSMSASLGNLMNSSYVTSRVIHANYGVSLNHGMDVNWLVTRVGRLFFAFAESC